MILKIFVLFLFLDSFNVNGLIEDVIDVLYLSREVIKTISSTWELADQVGVTNDIDLPFMQRKEKKIISRMAELTQEFRNAEMMVINWMLMRFKLSLIVIIFTSRFMSHLKSRCRGLNSIFGAIRSSSW